MLFQASRVFFRLGDCTVLSLGQFWLGAFDVLEAG